MSARLAALAAQYVGRRVEIAPHMDAWIVGDRFGTIVRVTSRGFHVRMDRTGRTFRCMTDREIFQYLD